MGASPHWDLAVIIPSTIRNAISSCLLVGAAAVPVSTGRQKNARAPRPACRLVGGQVDAFDNICGSTEAGRVALPSNPCHPCQCAIRFDERGWETGRWP